LGKGLGDGDFLSACPADAAVLSWAIMSNTEKDTQPGLVHVYTGSGKGKTTAALGIALRAVGWGAKVCVVQFIKGYPEIGEFHFQKLAPKQFVLRQFAVDCTRNISKAKVARRQESVEAALEFARQTVSSSEYDVVILDEINNAVHCGLVGVHRVLELVKLKPEQVELILTGRNAAPEIIEAADYVTEMRAVKHPYEQGIGARKMVDY
jgi:cob(I)alamin adenosyltransferase